MADDDGFITPPPGLINLDSGTHRRPRPDRTERIPNDEIVFVPAAPGVPVALPQDEPVPVEPDAFTPPAASTEQQPTAPIPSAWRLVIPGIEQPVLVDATAPLFLGRAPVAPPIAPAPRCSRCPIRRSRSRRRTRCSNSTRGSCACTT